MFKKLNLLIGLIIFITLISHWAYGENINNLKNTNNQHVVILNTSVPYGQFFKQIPYNELYKIETEHGGGNKKTVLKNIKIAKHSALIHTIAPLIPVGSFHGQLKKTGTVKIVFGLSGFNLPLFFETAGNIYYLERYLKLHNEKYKIAFVVYGAMAGILKKNIVFKNKVLQQHNRFAQALFRLHNEGVKIYVCYNALMYAHLVHYLLPSYIKTVPMGILKIYELRKRGYLYFTNP